MPFDLRLTNRQTNGPDGKKRTVPVFTFALKPRGGEIRLSSGNFRQLVGSGNRAAADLALPTPGGGSVDDDVAYAFLSEVEGPQPVHAKDDDPELLADDEHAEVYPEDTEEDWARYREEEGLPSLHGDADDADFKDVEPTEAELKQLEQNKDQGKMQRLWHATVKDSFLDSKEGRAEFLARNVDGLTSLKDVVGLLKAEQFDLLIVAAADEITERKKEDAAQAKLKDPQGWHESIKPHHARNLVRLVQVSNIKRTEVYPFISMIVKRPVSDRAEVTAADVDAVLNATGKLTGETWTYSEARCADKLMDFASWQTSDESAMGVL